MQMAVTGEGGGGGELGPAFLSTVRAPCSACSAPWPRSTYRLPYCESAVLGKSSSTTAWHAAFCVHSVVASLNPPAELKLCSGAPVCVKSTCGALYPAIVSTVGGGGSGGGGGEGGGGGGGRGGRGETGGGKGDGGRGEGGGGGGEGGGGGGSVGEGGGGGCG